MSVMSMWRSARATTRGAVWGGVERTPTARRMSMSAIRGRVRAFMVPARWMSMSAVFRVTARLGTRRAPASADLLDAAAAPAALAGSADSQGNAVVFECGKLAQLADGSATVQVCVCVFACECVYSQHHQLSPCWVCVCVCVCVRARARALADYVGTAVQKNSAEKTNTQKKPQMGNLVVLGTAVQKKIEAFYSGRTPLKVDYRERAVATGKNK